MASTQLHVSTSLDKINAYNAQICGAMVHSYRRLMKSNCPNIVADCCNTFFEQLGISG